MKDHRAIVIGHSELPRVESLARRIWPDAFVNILPASVISPMVDDVYSPASLGADIGERGHEYWLVTIGDRDATCC